MELVEATREVCNEHIEEAQERLAQAQDKYKSGTPGSADLIEVERWRSALVESEMSVDCIPVLSDLRETGKQIYLLDYDD